MSDAADPNRGGLSRTPTNSCPAVSSTGVAVRHFHQALLWPLRLMPDADARRMHDGHWPVRREPGDASPWREEVEEYTGDSGGFEQRHYNEFLSFLPYVQRFLYGEGRSHKLSEGSASHYGDSPMRIFRRRDIAAGGGPWWRGAVVLHTALLPPPRDA